MLEFFHQALLGRTTLAKQAFEDPSRIGLHWKWCRGGRPRETVHIDARKTVVTIADLSDQVRSELKRREGCVVADLLRYDLVDGRAQLVVAPLGVSLERSSGTPSPPWRGFRP